MLYDRIIDMMENDWLTNKEIALIIDQADKEELVKALNKVNDIKSVLDMIVAKG